MWNLLLAPLNAQRLGEGISDDERISAVARFDWERQKLANNGIGLADYVAEPVLDPAARIIVPKSRNSVSALRDNSLRQRVAAFEMFGHLGEQSCRAEERDFLLNRIFCVRVLP
jgi:hypothetical protein